MSDEFVKFLLALLSTGTVAGVIGAAANGFFNRKKINAEADKLGVDATEIITKAAATTVRNIKADNDDLRSQLRAINDLLDKHTAWDRLAVKRLHDAGIHLPDPPEMRLVGGRVVP